MRRLRNLVLLALALSFPGLAQAGDDDAKANIKRAIDEHYLMTDFDKATVLLKETIDGCGDCSATVKAKAYLYLGIVEGAGNDDLNAARKAFKEAVSLDPSIALDADLATRDTQRVFDEVKGDAPEASEESSVGSVVSSGSEPVGDMVCTPGPRAVQTNTVIPVSCQALGSSVSMELRYKPFGIEDFIQIPMEKSGEGFRGELPCSATELAGTLSFYVRAKDTEGEILDNFGSKTSPVELTVQNEPVEAPPSFPGQAPPARCQGEVICPPDFPGCESTQDGGGRGTKDWGAGCDNSFECKQGLLCIEGQCEAAPSCTVDDDCPVGTCDAGLCSVGDEPEEESASMWLGLHVAQDFSLVSGTNACSIQSQLDNDLHCFEYDAASGERDLPYPGIRANGDIGDPYPGQSIGSGFVVATTRLLFSFDYRLIAGLHGGVRLGYAFGGGPATRDAADFLPVHAEGRLSYWFARNSSFKPYVHLGGGLAQVDAKTELTGMQDCTTVDPDPMQSNPEQPFLDCIAGSPQYASSLEPFTVDVWKKTGQAFVTGGGGLIFMFTDSLGGQFNVNAMMMLPSSGFVLEPSLGVVYGL